MALVAFVLDDGSDGGHLFLSLNVCLPGSLNDFLIIRSLRVMAVINTMCLVRCPGFWFVGFCFQWMRLFGDSRFLFLIDEIIW